MRKKYAKIADFFVRFPATCCKAIPEEIVELGNEVISLGYATVGVGIKHKKRILNKFLFKREALKELMKSI